MLADANITEQKKKKKNYKMEWVAVEEIPPPIRQSRYESEG